ncbi:MAG: VWA domain-containing protein [Chloroflexi bacterium]|nr:VWA domain-containing protein [Chloroflexota bacterium]
MEFQAPEFLWLLLVIPALIVLYLLAQRRRSRFAIRYSNLSMVKEAIGTEPGWRRHLPPLLFLFGMMLIFVALARPTGIVFLPKQQGTVILAIDVSRSMTAADLQPNRLEAAKAAARDFINQQGPDVRIGIVSFSGNAALVQEPTTDHLLATAAVNRLSIQNSTAIGSGIMTSLDAIFEDPISAVSSKNQDELLAPTPTPTPLPRGIHIPATIIVLTDGRNRTGPDPIESAHTASDRGVRVFTIGVGTIQGATVQGGNQGNPGNGRQGGGRNQGGGGFRADLDPETLQSIADITDAKFFLASDVQALFDSYKNIDKEIVLTQKKEENTIFFAAASFVFMILSGFSSLWWFNRLP